MRWEALFADLEAQLVAAHAAELRADVAELTRAERATVTMTARLRAAGAGPLVVRVRSGELVSGSVVDVAEQWLLLGDGARRALVPAAALTGVRGLGWAAHPPDGVVGRRLGLAHALRALARDRTPVRITAVGGELVGRLDRVGADHVDLAAAAGGGPPGAGTAVWTVPVAAIDVVHSG